MMDRSSSLVTGMSLDLVIYLIAEAAGRCSWWWKREWRVADSIWELVDRELVEVSCCAR